MNLFSRALVRLFLLNYFFYIIEILLNLRAYCLYYRHCCNTYKQTDTRWLWIYVLVKVEVENFFSDRLQQMLARGRLFFAYRPRFDNYTGFPSGFVFCFCKFIFAYFSVYGFEQVPLKIDLFVWFLGLFGTFLKWYTGFHTALALALTPVVYTLVFVLSLLLSQIIVE